MTEFVDLGYVTGDGLTFEPAPAVTVELSDHFAALVGARTLTGGQIEGGMVRFDQTDGAVWISRDALDIPATDGEGKP